MARPVQYNMVWFQDADGEYWDLSKYRGKKERRGTLGRERADSSAQYHRRWQSLRRPAARVNLMMPAWLILVAAFISPSLNPALGR
jgi:hypothetical protein